MNSENSKIGLMDVLMVSYANAKAPPKATKDNSALLLIDIQHLAEPSYLAQKAINAGLDAKSVNLALSDYEERFNLALNNCAKILEAARKCEIVPIHVKIQSLSKTARDTGALHRRMGWTFPPGDKATEFLDCVKPFDDEIVITKTASGAFTGTSLESTLGHTLINFSQMAVKWLNNKVKNKFCDINIGKFIFRISMTPFCRPKDAALLHGSERLMPLKYLSIPADIFLPTAQNHSHHLAKINVCMT